MPNDYGMNQQQRDIVLAPNEFLFLQNSTNGVIKTHAGPTTITVSGQDTLVVFDERSKKFQPVQSAEKAKQLSVIAPENWYITLKNPTENGSYPEQGKGSIAPELSYGRKINIKGPASFALYPGQMAKVIRGHALRSNQYLLARVYEAESANVNQNGGQALDAEGKPIKTAQTYVNGQMLVIKGTEVSFYIPPTGIEVVPVNNDPSRGYVRDAITLERLEYCILKDEDGNKRYVHGPDVVFPKPTEAFVASPNGNYTFRAIELSPISGIYVKVIAEYTDEDNLGKRVHPVGEEMFITGNDQMIYYPRPEHAVISYDGKITHHAIAIPEGEGRYIMERLTGKIKTVKGPQMYLPDPRTEVVVKRRLTERQCELWYPGNKEALAYNMALTEKAVEKAAKKISADELAFKTVAGNVATMANLELNANISRNTSYTKPRTVTLDTKYDGAVGLDIWTGYAVNVVSKDGSRKVVCGPQSVLLDYDQTLEVLELSTGKPKTTDHLERTVFLRHEHNKVSDIVHVSTKDFVDMDIKVSYCVSFDPKVQDRWFSIENYVKYLCDHMRSLFKREAKQHTVEDFYQNYSDIVRDLAINKPDENIGMKEPDHPAGRYFEENGMYIYDCEVLGIAVERDVRDMLEEHQREMVELSLKLSNATRKVTVTEELTAAEQKEAELRNRAKMAKMELQYQEETRQNEIRSELARAFEAEQQAKANAENDLVELNNLLEDAKLAQKKKKNEQELEMTRAQAAIAEKAQVAYAETVKTIVESISPDLIAALSTKSNADTLTAVTQAMAPYAIARGESVPDTVNMLLRGTPMEKLLENITNK